MITPDTEVSDKGEKVPFVARWNVLVRSLLIDSSIKHIARAVCDYGIYDGEAVYPGNERIARETGYSARQVQEAWHFMRATGMALRDIRSTWTGTYRQADVYSLEIPAGWQGMAVLGPRAGKFTCLECGRKVSPRPVNAFKVDSRGHPVTDPQTGDRTVLWSLYKVVWCQPRRGEARSACRRTWERQHGSWGSTGTEDAWKLFRTARGDDWP